MEFQSQYIAKTPDSQGFINYTEDENTVWKTLFERQMQTMPGHACDEHIRGIELLRMDEHRIPQLPDINDSLYKTSGWQIYPVKALIAPDEFFKLLANRHFPAATFIRTLEELDYVKEPDIFHELFGHCPMLTYKPFGDFAQAYAQLVLTIDKKEWPLLQRMFWFTVEFGLIKTPQGLRAYGGGILSSIEETVYSVKSLVPQRRVFDPISVFRTPYRIDMKQTVYYIINSYSDLDTLVNSKISVLLKKAHELGEFEPTFPFEKNNPNIHIFCC